MVWLVFGDYNRNTHLSKVLTSVGTKRMCAIVDQDLFESLIATWFSICPNQAAARLSTCKTRSITVSGRLWPSFKMARRAFRASRHPDCRYEGICRQHMLLIGGGGSESNW